MGIGCRIIVAILATIVVLGIVLTAVPHSSAARTPIADGNFWTYLYDDTESGVRVNGTIKMQVDDMAETTVMGQSATVDVLSITGTGTIYGSYEGHRVTGSSFISGNQIRLASNFSLVSDRIVTVTNETVIGVSEPNTITRGRVASYDSVQDDYVGDGDHAVGCAMMSISHVTGTEWSDDGSVNETHALDNDSTMILRVLENGVSATTPAGTFSCHKISATIKSGGENKSMTLYYSDLVGNYVKMEGGDFYFGSMYKGLALGAYSYTKDTTRPNAMASVDRTAKVGHKVTFDATASTDDVGIVNYTWSFVAGPGPGTLHRLYGQKVHFTFSDARKYNVMLSVTDAAGNVAYDELTVTVERNDGMSVFFSAFSVVLVLVVVLIMAWLIQRRRMSDSPPKASRKRPSSKH